MKDNYGKSISLKGMIASFLFLIWLMPAVMAQPVYGPPECRDIMEWPFDQSSFWNMPIGSEAEYVPQPIDPDHISGPMAEIDIIILKPYAEDMPIYGTEYRWSSGTNQTTRCIKYNDKIHAIMPIPHDYITEFYAQTMPNNPAVIMKRDGVTLFQTQPCQTCPGGYATSGIRYSDPNDIITSEELSIYEEGRSGMHGGSGLNTMGGAIRLGELTSPNIDAIRHTLKISFPGHQYLYYDHTTNNGYRWPALKHDSNASSEYKSSNPEAKIGCLRALKPDLNIDELNLETLAAKKIAWTLQNYGAYQVEGVPWSKMMIAVEDGPNGAVVDEFREFYGLEFASEDKGGSAWVRDLMKIIPHLHIVSNNGPNSVGGGGEPLQPLAPLYCYDKPETFTIVASSGANGFISPSGSNNYLVGVTQTYIMTPKTGYLIEEVIVDDVSLGVVDSYTFASITSNHTITVTFKVDETVDHSLFVYPNPTEDVLFVEIADFEANAELNIINMEGMIVFNTKMNENRLEIPINTMLASGMYIIQYVDSKKMISQRIVLN